MKRISEFILVYAYMLMNNVTINFFLFILCHGWLLLHSSEFHFFLGLNHTIISFLVKRCQLLHKIRLYGCKIITENMHIESELNRKKEMWSHFWGLDFLFDYILKSEICSYLDNKLKNKMTQIGLALNKHPIKNGWTECLCLCIRKTSKV